MPEETYRASDISCVKEIVEDMASRGLSMPTGARISQRQPLSCAECSRRKVRCDKQVPCGRCVRLRKSCSREVVRTSKAVARHQDELLFLRRLDKRLQETGNPEQIGQMIQERIDNLEYGEPQVTSSPAVANPSLDLPLSPIEILADSRPPSDAESIHSTTLVPDYGSALVSDCLRPCPSRRYEGAWSSKSAATMRCLESLAWGRYTGSCYPHRRCNCIRYRTYTELASINCDTRDAYLERAPANMDLSVLLPAHDDRKLIQDFHMNHLWWHHNGFHSITFLEQCEIFWTSGTITHPLWMALYLSMTCTSLWTLVNSPRQRRELGIVFLDDLVELQFKKMVEILYNEDFLQNPSMFSVQAITLATRVGHNLGLSQLTANLLAAAHGIARSLGLHRIQSPAAMLPTNVESDTSQARSDWFEQVEIETGKRTWWQLVIQDYFSIPFTETYAISPAQFTSEIPKNCNDNDLIRREDTVMTSSAYTRIIAQQALLMTPALDGLGPLGARKQAKAIYEHILKCDFDMRQQIHSLPSCLLREGPDDGQGLLGPLPWLPTARRTMAISAADKIINIHRPLLFYSFQSPNFPRTRATCTAAAVTILREHERASAEDTVAVWTQTAFCITAVIVLGLELLHHSSHTSEAATEYRQLLSKAAERLRKRACDVLATKCATLIEVLLSVEEELVIKVMRKREGTLEEKQREAVDELIASQDILAKFLDLDPASEMRPTFWESPAVSESFDPAAMYDIVDFEDFDVWYNEVFSGNAFGVD